MDGVLTFLLVADVGHKSHKSCSLNSNGQLTLMLCTSAGDAAGKDLCTLGSKLAETSGILVIDVLYLIQAELADLLLSAVVLTELTLTLRSFVSIHLIYSYSAVVDLVARLKPLIVLRREDCRRRLLPQTWKYRHC